MSTASEIRRQELNSQLQYRLLHKLEESRQHYHDLVEALPDVVFKVDDTGRLEFVNGAWQRILGYDSLDSLGMRLVDLAHPEDRSSFEEAMARLIGGNHVAHDRAFRLLDAAGSYRWLALSGRGIEDGKPVGMLRDVTDSHLMRRELLSANAHLEERNQELHIQRVNTTLILQGIEDGVVVLDTAGRVLTLNDTARELMEIPNTFALGDSIEPFLSSLCNSGHGSAGGFDHQNPGRYECVSDDGVRVLALIVSAYYDEAEVAKGSVLILRDVTRQRELVRLKSDFVASVSHELRTPLTSIIGFASMLANPNSAPNQGHQRLLTIILDESRRLETLIEGLLNLSQIESGEFGVRLKRVELRPFLEGCLRTHAERAHEHGVHISLDFNGPTNEAVIDPERMSLALGNLIDNAIKFSPVGGQVVLSASRSDASLVFEVRDQGMGIPAEHLPHVFERFYRVPRPTKEIPGTGFGLAIVREVANRHGGVVEVDSAVGQGTSFRIVLGQGADGSSVRELA